MFSIWFTILLNLAELYIRINIKFNVDIKKLRSELNKFCHVMQYIKVITGLNILRSKYFDIFTCVWCYGILGGGDKETEKHFRLWKSVIRCISTMKRATSCSKLFKYKIPSQCHGNTLQKLCIAQN